MNFTLIQASRFIRGALTACAGAAMLLAAPLHAERADRTKPITLEADRMTIDDLKKVQVYEGKVILNQGTLSIHADKIVVTQDADGFSHGVATVAPGALATFREKLDDKEEYVEGWGERIEYDAKADKAELFTRARLKRTADEVRGNYISYDGKTEFFQAKSAPEGRVTGVIMPKNKGPVDPAKPAVAPERGALGLKPSGVIANPREE